MSWVTTWRVPPPANKTISVRFGSSVCFAAYKPLLDKWVMIAGGREEEIAAPSLWWCENKISGMTVNPSGSMQNHSGTESHSAAIGHVRGNTKVTARGEVQPLLPDQNFMRRSRKPKQLNLL